MLRITCALASALAVSGVAVPPIQAQTVRGRVTEGLTKEPLAGATVQLLVATDSVVASTLTTSDGRFLLVAVRTTGPLRLRTRKIGYRAATIAVSADTAVNVSLDRLPTTLPPISVIAVTGCGDDQTSTRARELWQDARASWLAGAQAPYDTPGLLIREPIPGAIGGGFPVILRARSVPAAFAIARAALERFLTTVSATAERGSATKSGDPLLDERFALTHCLRIEPGKHEHAGETALRFTRPRHDTSRVAIEGRFWLDTLSGQIRSLDFEYVEPRIPKRERAFGHAVFALGPAGLAVVGHWGLHIPEPRRRVRDGVRVILPPSFPVSRLHDTVDAAALVGGWDSTLTYEGSLPHLIGRAIDRRTGAGLKGVRIEASPAAAQLHPRASVRSTVTDSVGNFELDLPGRTIKLAASDTTLEEFRPAKFGAVPEYDWDVQLPPRESLWDPPPWGTIIAVNVSYDRNQHAMIRVTTTLDAFRHACRHELSDRSRGILVARVDSSRWADSASLGVDVRWSETESDGRMRAELRHVATDSTGRFWVCGVPRRAKLEIQTLDGRWTEKIETSGLEITTLVLRRTPDERGAPAGGTLRTDGAPAAAHLRKFPRLPVNEPRAW